MGDLSVKRNPPYITLSLFYLTSCVISYKPLNLIFLLLFNFYNNIFMRRTNILLYIGNIVGNWSFFKGYCKIIILSDFYHNWFII